MDATTTTKTNPDGSKTIINTSKTGQVTEKTYRPDGLQTGERSYNLNSSTPGSRPKSSGSSNKTQQTINGTTYDVDIRPSLPSEQPQFINEIRQAKEAGYNNLDIYNAAVNDKPLLASQNENVRNLITAATPEQRAEIVTQALNGQDLEIKDYSFLNNNLPQSRETPESRAAYEKSLKSTLTEYKPTATQRFFYDNPAASGVVTVGEEVVNFGKGVGSQVVGFGQFLVEQPGAFLRDLPMSQYELLINKNQTASTQYLNNFAEKSFITAPVLFLKNEITTGSWSSNEIRTFSTSPGQAIGEVVGFGLVSARGGELIVKTAKTGAKVADVVAEKAPAVIEKTLNVVDESAQIFKLGGNKEAAVFNKRTGERLSPISNTQKSKVSRQQYYNNKVSFDKAAIIEKSGRGNVDRRVLEQTGQNSFKYSATQKTPRTGAGRFTKTESVDLTVKQININNKGEQVPAVSIENFKQSLEFRPKGSSQTLPANLYKPPTPPQTMPKSFNVTDYFNKNSGQVLAIGTESDFIKMGARIKRNPRPQTQPDFNNPAQTNNNLPATILENNPEKGYFNGQKSKPLNAREARLKQTVERLQQERDKRYKRARESKPIDINYNNAKIDADFFEKSFEQLAQKTREKRNAENIARSEKIVTEQKQKGVFERLKVTEKTEQELIAERIKRNEENIARSEKILNELKQKGIFEKQKIREKTPAERQAEIEKRNKKNLERAEKAVAKLEREKPEEIKEYRISKFFEREFNEPIKTQLQKRETKTYLSPTKSSAELAQVYRQKKVYVVTNVVETNRPAPQAKSYVSARETISTTTQTARPKLWAESVRAREKTATPLRQAIETSTRLKTPQSTAYNLKQDQRVNTNVLTLLDTKSLQATATAQTLNFDSATLLDTAQKQQQAQRQTLTTTNILTNSFEFPKSPNTPIKTPSEVSPVPIRPFSVDTPGGGKPKPKDPNPPPPVEVKPPRANDDNKKKKKNTGFIVKVRLRGKFVNVNTNVYEKEQALNFGANYVKNTSAASFKVEPVGRETNAAFNIYTDFKDFMYKQGVYIQKRGTRISTPGEKREITYKGIMANQLKSRLLK